jgi:hypothetical protein
MHASYFYPADVMSIILAFFVPQLWFIPLCYQAISSLAYSIFLFGADRSTMLILATQLNTLVVGYLLWKQFHLMGEIEKVQHHTPQAEATGFSDDG